MMSHREIRPEDAVDVRSIEHVIAELREPVPVRAEWRVGLLRGIAMLPPPGEGGGRATVRFVYVAPYASRVALVGDFNAWNPAAMPMRRSADGRAWMIDVPLMRGRHVYAFVVDGDLAPDPAAPRAGDDD